MSGQSQRLNVVPTVTMLGVVKARLIGATRGHALLKKKSDALTVQFRAILKKIVATKESMGEAMRASSFSLAEAKYVAGDGVRHVVLQSVRSASLRVRSHQENVAGVKLPKFTHFVDPAGASSGGPSDELEREDFFRLKKIQGYKRREVERQMAAAKLFAEEQLAEDLALKRGTSMGAATNILVGGGDKDEDIIF
uniref:V-type proton ATPase subunit D n=1 Tax=Triticum urartu TaxID=4572 RepID=A0A8R7PKI0_TRIUA